MRSCDEICKNPPGNDVTNLHCIGTFEREYGRTFSKNVGEACKKKSRHGQDVTCVCSIPLLGNLMPNET